MKPPFLSAYDPLAIGEGSVDPLGLAPVYERLADRMLPAVTVRMGRLRFVTLLAVGALVCHKWPTDRVAKDGVTPPWLVYEWFVIEAFVREHSRLVDDAGIPGIRKARRAIANGRPLDTYSYLKTATTFGFTGIFRRLALHLDVLTPDGRLDDSGYRLVEAWAKGLGLDGFVDGTTGRGARFRAQLTRAIEQGLERGSTAPLPVELRQSMVDSLDPGRLHGIERKVLRQLLIERAGPPGKPEFVPAITEALISRQRPLEADEEGRFLQELPRRVHAELATLIQGINVYERLCGLLTDSFDWIRFLGHQSHGAPVGVREFKRKEVEHIFKAIPAAISAVERHPQLLTWEPEIARLLDAFRSIRDVTQFFTALLEHHRVVQDDKPPEGKEAWFEQERDDRVFVRADYVLETPPAKERIAYVHEYRLPTFSRFLADLGAF
ncbi:MAG: hypothetical protein IRZ28_12315 [Steroidobacteraceae bacterium]|nr:hypothetical protein [Steroidobacteraceae bacterium]